MRGKKILILVGPGNNGGDGLVAARYLHDAGDTIRVYLLKPREDEHVDALLAREVPLAVWPDDRLQSWLADCDVIVDALLGTGTARSIGGDLAELLITVQQAVSARRSAVPDLIDPAWPLSLQRDQTHSSRLRLQPLRELAATASSQ